MLPCIIDAGKCTLNMGSLLEGDVFMQQHPHDNQQPPQQPPQQPYGGGQPPYGGQQPPYGGGPQYPYGPQQPEKKPNVVMAAIALGGGLFAMIVPIPVIDVILGIMGIVLAALAMKSGVRGLAIAALIVSIIGTMVAISFTISVLAGFPSEWALTTQMLLSR